MRRQLLLVALAAAAALVIAPTSASAQAEEDHSAHHPAADAVSAMPPATSSPSQIPTPSSNAMAQMMSEMMGEGEHHRRQVDQFYPRLIGLPALSDDDRHRLAGEVDMRIHQGLALLHRGIAGADRAGTTDEARLAADQVREGLERGRDAGDEGKPGRGRELLERLAGLRPARMGRHERGDLLDHRQPGLRRTGFTEDRASVFTQEQDLRGLAGVIGRFPVPGAFRV